MDENLSSDVGTEVDQGLDILLGSDADNLIRMIDVKPFRFHQQPVESNDLDATLFGGSANRFSLFGDISVQNRPV